jgi:thiol-disulfide isomerase/thioredoxin
MAGGVSRRRCAPLLAAVLALFTGTVGPAQPPKAAKPSNTAQPPTAAQPRSTAQPPKAAKPSNTAQPPTAAQPSSPAQPGSPAKPTLAAVDHAGLMAAVARHKGKVVVLDCWSTSCPPCVKEFPRLVALQERYRDTVVCMSVSLDFEGLDSVDMLVPPVLRFLQGVNAGGVVNLIATEEADTMYKKLELDSVPAVYVWKADGTLARRFDEGDAKTRLGRPFTYDDVEAEVQGLLAK